MCSKTTERKGLLSLLCASSPFWCISFLVALAVVQPIIGRWIPISSALQEKGDVGKLSILNVFGGVFRYSKLFGIVFTSLLLVASVVVIIMSSKGIAKSTSEVKDVVPEAFKFLDRTYKDVHSIYVNLTEAVENGNRLVQGMRDAADALEQDFLSIAPTSDSQRRDIENSIEELRKQTDDVKVSLNRVDEEINDVRRASFWIFL